VLSIAPAALAYLAGESDPALGLKRPEHHHNACEAGYGIRAAIRLLAIMPPLSSYVAPEGIEP
jgi:hypothetical protein